MPTKKELEKGFQIGEWEVLPAKGVLRSGDREEKPEPKVLEVLLALAARDGDLVTRDELIEEIWEGRPTSDEPINRCLSQLRGHLGDQERPHQYIETLTRRGYRLNKAVRLMDPDQPEAIEEQRAERSRNQGRLWMLLSAIVVTVLIAGLIRSNMFATHDGSISSIAVLPFDNLSGDAADHYLVSGFKEELVQTLHHIPNFSVKPGRVAYPDLEASDIAQLLDVDAVLFGALQRNGDTLKITYQVARGYDGKIVSSGDVTGQVGDAFRLQVELAVLLRNDLFGESPQQLVSSIHYPSAEAYDRYMRGLFAFERRGRGHEENLDAAIELFEQSIAVDPGFGPAYLSLATAYALLPDYRNAPLEQTHQQALEVVERGKAVDDSIRDAAGAVIGFVYHKQKQWAKAEEAYLRATTAKVVDSNAFNWYSLMLAGVGRVDDALEQILIAQRIDPSSAVINRRVAILYTWTGNNEKAAEFYERADSLGASSGTDMLGKSLLFIREGRVDEAANLVAAGVSMGGGGTDWIGPVFSAIKDHSKRDRALAAIDKANQEGRMDPRIGIVARTILGDTNGAMQMAMSSAEVRQFAEMDFLFLPELRPLREHPDFLDLITMLGVQAYWDATGCTWQNDSVNCVQRK